MVAYDIKGLAQVDHNCCVYVTFAHVFEEGICQFYKQSLYVSHRLQNMHAKFIVYHNALHNYRSEGSKDYNDALYVSYTQIYLTHRH